MNDKKNTFDKFQFIYLLQYAAQNVENNNFLIILNLQWSQLFLEECMGHRWFVNAFKCKFCGISLSEKYKDRKITLIQKCFCTWWVGTFIQLLKFIVIVYI